MATIRTLLDQAKAALVAGKAEAALAPCRAVLDKYPKQLEATCLLAEACRELRQLPEAMDLFERVVSADPESLIGHWGLSTILEEQGQSEAALYELRIAWDLSPGHPAVREELMRLGGAEHAGMGRAGLARVYWRGHQYRRALFEARAVLAAQPERLDVGVLLAEVMWRMGRRDEAAELCADLLAESPDCLKALLIRGHVVKDGRKQLDPECRVAASMTPLVPLAAREVDLDEETVSLPPLVAEALPPPPARVSVLAAAELVAPPALEEPRVVADEPLALVEESIAEEAPTVVAEEPALIPEELPAIAEPAPPQPPVPDWLASHSTETPAETVAAAGLDPNLYSEWADLLAEEVDLDPAAAARLEAALAEATGTGTGSGPWKEIVLDGVSLTPPAMPAEPEPPRPIESAQPASSPEDELAALRNRASDLDSLSDAFRDLLRARPDVASVAAIELRGLVEANPDHAGLRRALGDAYMRCGRFQKAIEEYNRAVATQPPAAVA
jgi:tetratricopeptide (TPR) repeat protein